MISRISYLLYVLDKLNSCTPEFRQLRIKGFFFIAANQQMVKDYLTNLNFKLEPNSKSTYAYKGKDGIVGVTLLERFEQAKEHDDMLRKCFPDDVWAIMPEALRLKTWSIYDPQSYGICHAVEARPDQ